MKIKLFSRTIIFASLSLLFLGACIGAQPIAPTQNDDENISIFMSSNMEDDILMPRPNYIQGITPKEYSIISKTLYEAIPEGRLGPRIESSNPEVSEQPNLGNQSSICVRPLMELLVQEGDVFEDIYPNSEKLIDRMELLVNDQPMLPHSSGTGGVPTSIVTKTPESPLTIWIENADYCWRAPVDVGQHKIVFRFHQTSGNTQEYTWFFEIRE